MVIRDVLLLDSSSWTTEYQSILRSLPLHYCGVPVSTRQHHLVCYDEPVRTSEYQFVLRSIILGCGVLVFSIADPLLLPGRGRRR